jgi:DNA-binding response OmpR family regulator
LFPAEKEDYARAPSARLRVLVVDDDPDTVATLLELLRNEGHEARGHGSGRAAVDALRSFVPDVVISDIAMPDVNGWTLAKEVRTVMGKHPTLIAITGQYTKSSDKVLSHLSGFDYYLTKPADPKVLLALVAGGKSGK